MGDDSQTLKSCWTQAERHRRNLENSLDSNGEAFQENVSSAIAQYQECLKIASQVSLFSSNETLDDVSSHDLQYLLTHYRIAELFFRTVKLDRKEALLKAREELEEYLRLLDQYEALTTEEARLLERYQEDKGRFSTAQTTDAARRREVKIQRFKEEKALKQNLEYLQRNPTLLETSDETLRQLRLTELSFATFQTFQHLESISQELQILATAPSPQPNGTTPPLDDRTRRKDMDGYSERLDPSMSSLLANANGGPILSQSGRPIRPFTLLDSRQRLQDGVFRPSHNLPTMTIDEYLEEEKRRGGIIEGGGEQSGIRPQVDEDDLEASDRATVEARRWDEFKEANPRGSGNTMNMG